MSYLTAPVFDQIHIPTDIIARIANWYLGPGSQKDRLNKSDIHMIFVGTAPKTSYQNINEALQGGSPLFDSLAYLSLAPNERPPIRTVTNLPVENTQDLMEVAQCLFVLFFYLMTRGNVPETSNNSVGTDIPAFIANYLGLKSAPIIYMQKLASFSLTKIHHTWIKHVDLTVLSPQALSRLSLGVAGYRWLTIFGFLDPELPLSADEQRAWNAIKDFISRGLFWDIQSVTRSPLVTMKFHSLNNVAVYLLTKGLSDATLSNLHHQKYIPIKPNAPPRIPSLVNITTQEFDQFKDSIFPADFWTKIEENIRAQLSSTAGP